MSSPAIQLQPPCISNTSVIRREQQTRFATDPSGSRNVGSSGENLKVAGRTGGRRAPSFRVVGQRVGLEVKTTISNLKG